MLYVDLLLGWDERVQKCFPQQLKLIREQETSLILLLLSSPVNCYFVRKIRDYVMKFCATYDRLFLNVCTAGLQMLNLTVNVRNISSERF